MGILVKVSNCKYIKYKTKQRERERQRQRQRQRQRERKEGRNSVGGGVRELREMANSWAKITFGCMQCCVQVAFGHIVVPSFM